MLDYLNHIPDKFCYLIEFFYSTDQTKCSVIEFRVEICSNMHYVTPSSFLKCSQLYFCQAAQTPLLKVPHANTTNTYSLLLNMQYRCHLSICKQTVLRRDLVKRQLIVFSLPRCHFSSFSVGYSCITMELCQVVFDFLHKLNAL